MTVLVVVRPDDPTSGLAVEAGIGFGGDIVAAAVGDQRQERALRAAVAVGARRAIRIEETDELPSSGVDDAAQLAPLVERLGPDLVLVGGRRGKTGRYGAGSALAELVGLPHIGSVAGFSHTGPDRLEAIRRRQGHQETVSCPLPAVLSIEWGSPLRYPTLPGRLRARRTEIEVVAGLAGSEKKVTLVRRTGPKPRRKLEQRSGPGVDYVLGLLLGGAEGGGGGQQLAGEPEAIAARVVDACNRAMGRG